MDQNLNDDSYAKMKKRASLRLLLSQHFVECEESLASGDVGKVRAALIKLEDKKIRLDKLDDELDPILALELDQDKYYQEMKEIESYHDRFISLRDQLNELLQPVSCTSSCLSTDNFSDSGSLVGSSCSLRGFKRGNEIDTDEWNRSSPSSLDNKRIRQELFGIDFDGDGLSIDDDFVNPCQEYEGRTIESIEVKQGIEEITILDDSDTEKTFVENAIELKTSVDQRNGNLIESNVRKRNNEPEFVSNRDAMKVVLNNDKILLEIFDNLDIRTLIVIERVCKKWQEISLQSWKSVFGVDIYDTFNVEKKKFDLYHLEEILRRGGKYITHLDCSYLKNPNEDLAKIQNLPAKTSLEIINSYCEKLTSLFLNFTWDEEHYLNYLDPNVLRNLTSLNVGNVKFCDKNLPAVLKTAVNLEKFSIAGYDYLDNTLLNLSQKCKTLSVFGSKKFSNEILEEVLITHPNIENLDVSDTDITPIAFMPFRGQFNALALLGTPNFFKNFFYCLNFNKLKFLELSYNGEELTGQKLKLLIDNCPVLEELRLRKLKFLAGEDFKYLEHANHLVNLDVSFTDITGEVLVYLARRKKFKQLFCHGCNYIPPISFNEIIDASQELTYLSIPSYRLSKKFTRLAFASLQKRRNNKSLIISLRAPSVDEIPERVEKLKLKNEIRSYSKTSILRIGCGSDESCGCDFYSHCICFVGEDILISF